MRRCLNSLLVGVLTFSLSVDAARACGHLRFRRCVPAPCHVPTVIVVGGACGCGCDGPPVPHVVAGCEEIPCGTPLDCCGDVVVSTPVVPQADSVVAPAPTVAAPEPAAPQPTLSVVPDLEPVAPASATEPVPAPAEPATEPNPEAEPEMDTIAAPDAGAAEPPADVTADAVEPEMVEPEMVEPEGVDAEPSIPDVADDAQEPEMEEEVPQPGPDTPEPVIEEPTPPAPQEPNPFDVPDTAAAEPQRRWIDATDSYAVVGRLVDFRGDEVDILRADGRLVTVPVDRLSDFDRDYVGAAGPRIAATRHRGPLPTDTAGR